MVIEQEPDITKKLQKNDKPAEVEVKITLPYPSRLKNTHKKKENEDREIIDFFIKFEVKIPILDDIK